MSKSNRNEPAPSRNADQEWSERLKRTGENFYGDKKEPRDPDQEKKQDAHPAGTDRTNDQSNKGSRNAVRAYYGGPYDVGNYASHYDDYFNRKGQQGISKPLSGKSDHRGKGPRGYQRSDARILEDVNDHLFLDPYVDATEIEVKVENAEVTLTGAVEDRDAKRVAEDIAYSIAGVKHVENRIRIEKTHIAGPVRSNVRDELM